MALNSPKTRHRTVRSRWKLYRIIARSATRSSDLILVGSSEHRIFDIADRCFPDADNVDVYEITRRPN